MKADKSRLSEMMYSSLDLPHSHLSVRENDNATDVLAGLFNTIVSEDLPLPRSADYDFSVIEQRSQNNPVHTKRFMKPARRFPKTLILKTAVSAATMLFLFGVLFFSNSKSTRPYTLLSWKGRPSIRINEKESIPKRGMTLKGRIRIRTRAGESIRISTGILQMYLASKSQVILEPISAPRGEQPTTQVQMDTGLAAFEVQPDRWKNFTVRTGNSLIEVIGTRFAVQVTGQKTRTLVSRGRISIRSIRSGKMRQLTAGLGAFIRSDTISIIHNPQRKRTFSSARTAIEQFTPRSLKQPAQRAPKKTAPIQKKRTPKKIKKPALSEKVYLKDGTVITGRIISQNEKDLLIRTSLGQLKIAMANIRRIVYSNK